MDLRKLSNIVVLGNIFVIKLPTVFFSNYIPEVLHLSLHLFVLFAQVSTVLGHFRIFQFPSHVILFMKILPKYHILYFSAVFSLNLKDFIVFFDLVTDFKRRNFLAISTFITSSSKHSHLMTMTISMTFTYVSSMKFAFAITEVAYFLAA